jgi:hypothetical protein
VYPKDGLKWFKIKIGSGQRIAACQPRKAETALLALSIEHRNLKLELRVNTFKGKPRIRFSVYRGTTRLEPQEWLSVDATARLDQILASPHGVQASELTEEFKARLLEIREGGDAPADAAPGDGTAAQGAGLFDLLAQGAGLFEPVDVVMAEVVVLADRRRQVPDRFEPSVTLRDQANAQQRRKRLATAEHDEAAPCKRPLCAAARLERDQAREATARRR